MLYCSQNTYGITATQLGGSVNQVPPEFVPRYRCVDDSLFGKKPCVTFDYRRSEGQSLLEAVIADHLLVAAVTQHRLVNEIRLGCFKENWTNKDYATNTGYLDSYPGSNRVAQLFSGRVQMKIADIGIAYALLGQHLPPLNPTGWVTQMDYTERAPRQLYAPESQG